MNEKVERVFDKDGLEKHRILDSNGNALTDYVTTDYNINLAKQYGVGSINLLKNSSGELNPALIKSNNNSDYPIIVTPKIENNIGFIRITMDKLGLPNKTLSVYSTLARSNWYENIDGNKCCVSFMARASSSCKFSLISGTNKVSTLEHGNTTGVGTSWKIYHSSPYDITDDVSYIRFNLSVLQDFSKYDISKFYLDIGPYWITPGVIPMTSWKPNPMDRINKLNDAVVALGGSI